MTPAQSTPPAFHRDAHLEAILPLVNIDGRLCVRAGTLDETITWHPAGDGPPDADLTVHVATEGCEEPTWLGYFDGETWRDVDGLEIRVTHWAEMLKGPHGAAGLAITAEAARDA